MLKSYSNANINEVLATAELGCQHLTVLPSHLKSLAETPLDETAFNKFPWLANPPVKKETPYYAKMSSNPRFTAHSISDPLAGEDWDGTFASPNTNFLADNGKLLDEAIANDAAMTRKLKDVLNCFLEADFKAKDAIEKEIANQVS